MGCECGVCDLCVEIYIKSIVWCDVSIIRDVAVCK